MNLTFSEKSNEKILINSNYGSILRTQKDFQVLYKHLMEEPNMILVPIIANNNFVRWAEKLIRINPNWETCEVLKNFFNNIDFYLEIKRKDSFMKNVYDKIEGLILTKSEFKGLDRFVDKKNEKHLHDFEIKVKNLLRMIDRLDKKIENLLDKYGRIQFLMEDIRFSFNYFITEENKGSNNTLSLRHDSENDKLLSDIKSQREILEDFENFFLKKSNIYERYRRLKLKILEERFGSNGIYDNVGNPQSLLTNLEKQIVEYNESLDQFLSNKEIFNDIAVRVKEILKVFLKKINN